MALEGMKEKLSAGTAKITKAAKLRKSNTQLMQLSNAAVEERAARNRNGEPSLNRLQIGAHLGILFFTFLSICLMGAVAAFQAKWIKVSGGVGFSLFILLFNFILSACLLGIPLAYDQWDKAKRAAQFLAQPRSHVILNSFGALLQFIVTLITTVSGFGNPGCKNPDNDPSANEDRGDDYKAALPGWCKTKQASAIFDWLILACWCILVALSAIAFRDERRRMRRREPRFTPPDEEEADLEIAPGYAKVGGEDVFDDKHEQQALPTVDYSGHAAPAPHPSRLAQQQQQQQAQQPLMQQPSAIPQSALARPSVDVYGAFDGDMPGAVPPLSRTMQMAAFNDPYAQVRASLDTPYQMPAQYTPPAGYTTPNYGYQR